MKALKTIGTILIMIVLLFFITAMFLPRETYFEESRVIRTDPVTAYSAVNDLHNWEKWSPWIEMDPKVKIYYIGSGQGQGAGYHWDGPVTGKGKLTILKSNPYKNVHFSLEFSGQGTSEGGFNFEGVPGGTRVSWYMEMHNLKYPFQRWIGIFMPPMMRKDFRHGLDNMQRVLMN